MVESKKLVKLKYIKVLYYTHRMKIWLKVGVVLVIAVLVVSSIYVVFYSEPEEDTSDKTEDTTEEVDETSEENNEDEQNEDQEFVHTVFIEEASYTTCKPCTAVASIIDELYKSGKYNFYYVALVTDESAKAEKRIYEDYNVYGSPVLFIDGGYRVLAGGGVSKSELEGAISDAEIRNVPEINIKVTAKYNENTSEFSTTVYAVSNEAEKYTGRLRVYLTEIISRWNQANSESYHYAFVDYIINKEISIEGKGNITLTDKRKITEFAVSDLLPEELMIFAVIFSSESVKADSFPASDKHGDFDAYFADTTNATLVVPGGNLPPIVSISSPETGKLYILSRPIYKFKLLHKTILVGKTTITADVDDESGVEKVEFYIDGELMNTDTVDPYEYSFSRKVGSLKNIVGKHTITVTAYDNEGKTNTASIDVITLL